VEQLLSCKRLLPLVVQLKAIPEWAAGSAQNLCKTLDTEAISDIAMDNEWQCMPGRTRSLHKDSQGSTYFGSTRLISLAECSLPTQMYSYPCCRAKNAAVRV
jgi:hypothetical protein